MNLQQLADLAGVGIHGSGDYAISGMRDIERLTSAMVLEENYLYFMESPAVLKRHPRAVEQGAVLTTPALADKFVHALVAPEGEIRLAFIELLKIVDQAPRFAP